VRPRYGSRNYLLVCLIASGAYTLCAAWPPDAPHLVAIAPDIGITTPGNMVAVHGSGFSPDAIVYFGGFQVRETKFISPSTLEVVTPYLRPGHYKIQMKSGGATVRSDVTFTASPSPVDTEIDHAVALAGKGQASSAIAILTGIAKNNSDYQIRAFVSYQIGQIYVAQGDLWRWAGEGSGAFLDSDKSGMAVQTSWRYRLSDAQSAYLLDSNTKPDYDLRYADIVVEFDVTQNPEPRFHRATAQVGRLTKQAERSGVLYRLAREGFPREFPFILSSAFSPNCSLIKSTKPVSGMLARRADMCKPEFR
jgi:IPT/TIG domain